MFYTRHEQSKHTAESNDEKNWANKIVMKIAEDKSTRKKWKFVASEHLMIALIPSIPLDDKAV